MKIIAVVLARAFALSEQVSECVSVDRLEQDWGIGVAPIHVLGCITGDEGERNSARCEQLGNWINELITKIDVENFDG
ncbi:MAG: hypothetical protein WB662_01685 [Methyloceanibacter sp.]